MALEELFAMAINKSRDRSFAKRKMTLSTGVVKSVDDEVCAVGDFEDVRLNAIESELESQVTVYPKIGSIVIIGRLEGEDDAFVVKCSEIDRVLIKIGSQTFEMKNGKFTIKNGAGDLKSILNTTLNQLKTSIIITPSGPGNFSPDDVLVFEQQNELVNQLMQ